MIMFTNGFVEEQWVRWPGLLWVRIWLDFAGRHPYTKSFDPERFNFFTMHWSLSE